MPAGSYGSASQGMEQRFGISQKNFPTLFWATTLWNMGAAILPLLFVPLSETSGRMPAYFVSTIAQLAHYLIDL